MVCCRQEVAALLQRVGALQAEPVALAESLSVAYTAAFPLLEAVPLQRQAAGTAGAAAGSAAEIESAEGLTHCTQTVERAREWHSSLIRALGLAVSNERRDTATKLEVALKALRTAQASESAWEGRAAQLTVRLNDELAWAVS